MRRLGVLIGTFIAGVAAALLALYLWLETPHEMVAVDPNDIADALALVVRPSLSRFSAGAVIYVKSGLGPVLTLKLQHDYPTLEFRPWASRPEDLGCKSYAPHALAVSPCERNDFIKTEVLPFPSLPTRALAVSTQTYNTDGQYVLFKVLGCWRVILERTFAR